MKKQMRAPRLVGVVVFSAILTGLWMNQLAPSRAYASGEGNGDPPARQEAVTVPPTMTPAQLAKLLNLSEEEAKILTAGCIGCTAALQGQTPVAVLEHPGVFGTATYPENYNDPATGTTTTGYDSKAAADAAAANPPAGSTVVEFQKTGGPPDSNGNPTSTDTGPFDYTTVVNINDTTYYVDANHADIPAGSAEFYASTTPPADVPPAGNAQGYTSTRWYVTVTTPPTH
jgi:hypothetical protein